MDEVLRWLILAGVVALLVIVLRHQARASQRDDAIIRAANALTECAHSIGATADRVAHNGARADHAIELVDGVDETVRRMDEMVHKIAQQMGVNDLP